MDLPRQFTYGPQWRLIFCFLVAGIALLLLVRVHMVSFGVGVGLGIMALGFALAGTLRRLVFPRSLELGQETLSVCTGFVQARVTRITYADVEQFWEVKIGRMTVLKLRTKGRTIEIVSTLLPDMASYLAVRDFLESR